jgi:mannose-6-phosphate isomerase-like protein (cupin superfamily)
MSNIAALTYALVALAQSNDLANKKVTKSSLPADALVALNKWIGTLNARLKKPTVSLESFADDVLKSTYSDGERSFFTLRYAYDDEGTQSGWLVIQAGEVIGETPQPPTSSGKFSTARLPVRPSAIAPDGTDVRVLLEIAGGSFAHFELAPGKISNAVTHRTIEEIWYFLGGRGEMWRKQGDREEIVPVEEGVCVTIPLGTRFQFHSYGDEPLVVVVVTMPPWPGGDEAYQVDGHWTPTIDR